jgi:hypothetical protein
MATLVLNERTYVVRHFLVSGKTEGVIEARLDSYAVGEDGKAGEAVWSKQGQLSPRA